jgi:hypothetical protein
LQQSVLGDSERRNQCNKPLQSPARGAKRPADHRHSRARGLRCCYRRRLVRPIGSCTQVATPWPRCRPPTAPRKANISCATADSAIRRGAANDGVPAPFLRVRGGSLLPAVRPCGKKSLPRTASSWNPTRRSHNLQLVTNFTPRVLFETRRCDSKPEARRHSHRSGRRSAAGLTSRDSCNRPYGGDHETVTFQHAMQHFRAAFPCRRGAPASCMGNERCACEGVGVLSAEQCTSRAAGGRCGG